MEPSKLAYFQYFKEQNLPLFIKVDLSQFDPSLYSLLVRSRFTELKGVEVEAAEQTVKKNVHGRVLSLELAGPITARQLDAPSESDRFGLESVTPRDNFKVYRYKGFALMMYAFSVKEWRLGAFNDFADKSNAFAAHQVINRFLSLALTPLGFLGLWAVPVKKV